MAMVSKTNGGCLTGAPHGFESRRLRNVVYPIYYKSYNTLSASTKTFLDIYLFNNLLNTPLMICHASSHCRCNT